MVDENHLLPCPKGQYAMTHRYGNRRPTDKTDKNLLFGGARLGKMGLCVKAKRSARCGGSGLLYRVGAYENAMVGELDLFKGLKLRGIESILAVLEQTGPC